MSENKETKTSKKSQKRADKQAAKAKKQQQKRTAEISRQRLNRISHAKKHHVRTTRRILKYGSKSFVRNTWLSLAAIAIMTITLLILAATVIATSVMATAIKEFEAQVDISVYIRQTASREEVENITERMSELPSVTGVAVTSPDEASNKAIDQIAGNSSITDQTIIEDLQAVPVILPWTINVTLQDIGDTAELEHFVENDASMHNMLDAKEPTYATKDRETINNIADVMHKVELVGFALAGAFAIIAILIVFNTIRMAIFNRKEEIYMMRLVGASTSFIIGPFLVEASMYGIVAAILASAAAFAGTFALKESAQFGALVTPSYELMTLHWYVGPAILIVLGMLIGVFSALCATRKYLKVK